MLKFVITRDTGGRYYWNCYAPQGESLARSGDSYHNWLACRAALQRIIHILPAHAQVEIEEALPPDEADQRKAYAA